MYNFSLVAKKPFCIVNFDTSKSLSQNIFVLKLW